MNAILDQAMKSFTGSAAIVGLVSSIFFFLQGITIGLVSTLYFTGFIPADAVQIGSTISAIFFFLLFIALSLPGFIGFKKRKEDPANIFLKVQGWILSLFLPIHVFVLPVPGPFFLFFILVGAMGIFILATLRHAKRMEVETDSPGS